LDSLTSWRPRRWGARSAASNLLRLLQLAEPVQALLMAGDLDMGHARALLALDKAHQITTATEVVARKLSVREAERLVAKVAADTPERAARQRSEHKSRDVERIEEELSDLLTAQVEIQVKRRTKRGDQGEVRIGFGSLDELNGLIERLRGTRA
jgi:ParB family transcriptional regulator, chromosome partitioning protein